MKTKELKRLTTFKIGGKAKYLSVCRTITELEECLTWCKNINSPWFILGGGSNVLISDNGFSGLVIKLSGDFKNIKFNENIVEAGSAVSLPVLSRQFLKMNWGGFEFMCHIPGTIGGAVQMNAGTKQGEIKDYFVSAKLISQDGKIRTIDKQRAGFSYRHTNLMNNKDIILSAKFFRPFFDDPINIKKKIKKIISDRRNRQPKNRRNCGSVFKSFPGQKPAGWFIDRAGLKGTKVGDAMVAYEHANWIVNLGNAAAEDVKKLIIRIQEEVFAKFGTTLEREVVYIPDDIVGD